MELNSVPAPSIYHYIAVLDNVDAGIVAYHVCQLGWMRNIPDNKIGSLSCLQCPPVVQ